MSSMQKADISPRQARVILIILLVAQAMAVMDNSIVAVATATIQDDLRTSGGALQLILSGYTLTFAIFVITGARFGDDFGQRRMFLVGLAGFTIASLLCGIAPTAAMLIGSRIAQGFFGAMMVPQVLSSIQLLFTGEARSKAIGYYSMILALGVAGGQILGGAIVTADLFGSNWRAAFLINVPIGIALYLTARTLLPSSQPEGRQRIDFVGMIAMGLTMASLVIPLVLGREQGWPLWAWVVLALAGPGLWFFIGYEKRLARQDRRPILDPRSVAHPGVKPGLLACCLLNLGFAGVLFSVILHLQNSLGYSPLLAGLMFVPMPVGFAAVSMTWTRLPKRAQGVLPIVGCLAFAVAAGGLALTAATGWSVVAAAALLVLAGAGMAAGFSTLVAQASAAVGPEHASAISALVSTGTLLFSVLSVAGIGSIYLAFAEDDPAGSAEGLAWALSAVAVLLALAAACATRTWLVATRHQPSEEPVMAAQTAAD